MTHVEIETEAITAVAQQAAGKEPVPIDTGRRDYNDMLAFVLAPGQHVHTVDLDKYQNSPHRMSGTSWHIDHATFAEFCKRHYVPDASTLWGNPATGVIVAVFNDHGADGLPGWADHRAILQLTQTEDWTHWVRNDGRYMAQASFAEHLEEGAECVVDPSAADMLEIAQTFTAKNNVNFRSSTRLDNGEVQLVFEESVQAKAGQKGSMTIPTSFSLGLQPFEGSERYRVMARFRYRIVEGRLSMAYKMVRPNQVLTEAFNDITASIKDVLGAPVLLGTRDH